MTEALRRPPRVVSSDGAERRVGVEIEFSGLDCQQAARLVRERFGGITVEYSRHRFSVSGTRFGDFKVELDTHYADHAERYRKEADLTEGTEETLKSRLYESLSDVTSLWLPVEIVAPPVPISELGAMDAIVADLRRAGAEGTDRHAAFAFSTQLNPEVPSLETSSIVDHLKAFLLLSPWLRQEINLDLSRRLLPFIDPFPESYRRKVLDPDYRPGRAALIDDYLDHNATRNRELDLLPLLAHLDADRVRGRLQDPRVKARPTYHYRLPDTRLSDPDWNFTTEWNRWVRVEDLAEDGDRLRAMAEDCLATGSGWLPGNWIAKIRQALG